MKTVPAFIKKTLKAILWMAGIFVLLFLIVAGIIQIPVVQNKIINFATTFVSNKTQTRVEIKNVSIAFPKSVVVEGIYLEDLQQDTLLYAGKIKINIVLKDLLSNHICVNRLSLENLHLNLYNTNTDSLFNYNFLLTAFSDTTKQTKIEPENPSEWEFSVDNVYLKNIRLRYFDDFGGMRVAAAFDKLALEMDEIDIKTLTFKIDDLLVNDLYANIVLKESSKVDIDKPATVLPILSANNIQINRSTIIFIDSINKQAVTAGITRFELKEAFIDLNKEKISLDKIYLFESNIKYASDAVATAAMKTQSDPEEANNWQVDVKSIILKDNILAYRAGNKAVNKKTFDAENLRFRYLYLEATDFHYSTDETKVLIERFSAVDQNNFAITRFETDFSMDKHAITADKLKVKTSHSSIDADVNMQFSSLDAIQDELPELILNANIRKSAFSNADILYFSPELIEQDFFKDKKNITAVTGQINGSINNLKGQNIVIKTGSKTAIKTNFHITGLPEIETACFDFPNLTINSGKQDILKMGGSAIPENISIPEEIDLQVIFKGMIKAFSTDINLNSSMGNLMLLANLDQQENFNADLNINDFDLGSLLQDKKMFGPVKLTAQVNGKGLTQESVQATIKADVADLYLNQYTYHKLTLNGKVANQQFEGNINLDDENAVFDFGGLVDFNAGEERFKFNLNVQGADLQKLNFTTEDMRIGFSATADLKGGTVDKLNGKASITNFIIAQNGKKYVLDSLMIASINEPKRSEINFSSAIVGIKYSGTISPVALASTLSQFIGNYFQFNKPEPEAIIADSSSFQFEIQLHNHPIISEVLLPDLNEFKPGIIEGSFNSQKNALKLHANMQKIVYGTTVINDFSVDIISDLKALNYKISISDISNDQIRIENLLLDGKLADNTITANIASIDKNLNKKLQIWSLITKENDNYKIVLDPENFYLMNNRWDIAADHYIEVGDQGFLIHHLFMQHAGSEINIASVNDKFNDDLHVEIKNFKLDDIARIIEKDSNLLKGNLAGNVLLKRVNNSYGIIADATITDLIVQTVPTGNLRVKADNPTTSKFDIDISLTGEENNLTAKGFFIPNGGENSINIQTDIQSLSMKTAEAFSMGQISESSGSLGGNISISGNTDSPEITGELIFKDVLMKPAFLNNRIGLKNETIRLKSDGIYFDSFTLRDVNQHKAIIDGSVQMKQFSDFKFALRVNSTDFLLFNTTIKDNDAFYGRMVVDSRIDITGPMSLPVINAKMKMKKGSHFTFIVPEDRYTTDKGEDVVIFVDSSKYNPILDRNDKIVTKSSSLTGFDLTSIIEVDKEATLRLFMDPTSSDSLVVKGEAALSFTMDRSGKMSLTGAYNLNEGSYLVSLESIIKKRFDIVQGSTIIWNGDPLDANINIDATYTVRTAPFNLVAEQMAGLTDVEKGGYRQIYPFLVVLKLRGAILEPQISFEIQLMPEDKGILGGAVNQKLILLNEDPSALNKQVFALLVLARFVQENPLQSETGGASTLVRSTVSNFLSAQLNKLSSQVVPGVEMNFDIQSYDDFQTGEAQGRTQVEIGLKKQLFNERLTVQVGGSVDVEGEKAKQNSASDITGDVTVEYKLTEDGRYRLKGFRHNQYEGALEGQLVETGVGVVYVRDFNRWKEFLKSPTKKGDSVKEKTKP